MATGSGRRRAVLAALLVIAAVAAGQGLATWLARHRLASGAAEWIWAPLPRRDEAPTAFWAVRDFRLAEVPEQAELLALADEEYVVWLNGRRVGSNRYRPQAPLDVYRVAPLLLPGGNRLAVELRSGRAHGGFLAALDLGGTAPPLVTDTRWRILRRQPPGLRAGWAPIGEAAHAVSWGRPPAGRWGRPGRGPLRPLAGDACELCAPLAARGRDGQPPERVVFDFGREVYGYLELERSPAAAAVPDEVGLLLTGGRPAAPLEDLAAAPVLPVPGATTWSDVAPRRLRYASVTGLAGLTAARVLPVDPAAAARLPTPVPGEAAGPTLLGVDALTTRTAVRDAVRRRLASSSRTGVTGDG